MAEPDPALFDQIAAAVAERMGEPHIAPFILGLCGAQGSGKTTVAAALAAHFDARGVPTAILSLDDLYKTRAERAAMARAIHPLFATRGVPGTHDVALGLEAIAGLRAGRTARLPRFDKAVDDRAPPEDWPLAPQSTKLLILEGWMVGARPQPEDALAEPVNALERDEDADGRWRRHANRALADYRPLFDAIDLLVLLAAPGFERVQGWRAEQEAKLRAEGRGGMEPAAIARFVAHYERLTRHILADMPSFADLVLPLGADRSLVSAPAGSGRG